MRTLAVLGGHRTFIVRSVFAGVLSGVGITLLLPRHYTTTFSFIPQTAMDGGKSGLASLAGQFGVSIGGLPGQSTPPQLYADLLVTREILVPIATDSVPTGTSGAPRVRMPEFLSVRGDRPDEVIERTVAKL
ncbi:MAG: hypothetical protein HY275_01590, partial [Gemmatimonadetes bacterium]|nr:hypothetical protein [Gemmatimonadota bacterium]